MSHDVPDKDKSSGVENAMVGTDITDVVVPPTESSEETNQYWGANKLTAPRVLGVTGSGGYMLQLDGLDLKVQIHLSVAFVSLKAKFRNNNAEPAASYAFELPTSPKTTITNASFEMLTSGASYQTIVIEDTPNLEDFRSKEGEGLRQAMEAYKELSGRDIGTYSPEVFALPFHNLGKDEVIEICVDYMEQIECNADGFVFEFPMFFTQKGLGTNADRMKDILDISLKLNPGLNVSSYNSSHELEQVDMGDTTQLSFKLFKEGLDNKNESFIFKYTCWEDDIVCKAFLQQGANEMTDATMSLLVMPPNPKVVETKAEPSKHVVFILDRSGSMGFTNVLESAKSALMIALRQLRPQDKFAICAFDHKQYWFAGQSPEILTKVYKGKSEAPQVETMENEDLEAKLKKFMIPVSEPIIQRACDWVKGITPGGLTNIIDPLKQAVAGLNVESMSKHASPFNKNGAIPMVFLVTDGAVENEREICAYVNSVAHSVRFFTFGIGLECNAYFLRKVASLGRGCTDVSMLPNTVAPQLQKLFERANHPLFLNIGVKLGRSELQDKAEWFPAQIPDVFEASPVVASCSLHSRIVDVTSEKLAVTISGERVKSVKCSTEVSDASETLEQDKQPQYRCDISAFSVTIDVKETTQIPLQQVFVKQRLETLITESWFKEGEAGTVARKQCVDLAVKHSVPSAYTRMVLVDKNDVKTGPNGKKTIVGKKAIAFVGASVVGAAAFGAFTALDGSGVAGDLCCSDVFGEGDCCDCDCEGIADCCSSLMGSM